MHHEWVARHCNAARNRGLCPYADQARTEIDMKYKEMRELQKRALRALSRIRKEAARRGLDKASPEFIDAEIRAVRARRKRSAGK